MVDSPSSILLLRLQATGGNTNLWGGYLNTALSTLERAAKGYQAYSTATDSTISWTNYSASNDFAVAFVKMTGTATAAFTTTQPGYKNFFGINNASGYTNTHKVSGGTGIAVPTSRTALLYNDGTDVREATPNWLSGYVATLSNNGDIVVKATLEAAIAAASGLTAPFIMVSVTDTTPGYLASKITGSGAVVISTLNGGADEDLQIAVGALGLTAGSAQTTDFTAAVNTKYVCNFSASATITLPSSASVGDLIEFTIGGGQSVTINPNGLKVNASTANLPIGNDRGTLLIGYTGTTDGWV